MQLNTLSKLVWMSFFCEEGPHWLSSYGQKKKKTFWKCFCVLQKEINHTGLTWMTEWEWINDDRRTVL